MTYITCNTCNKQWDASRYPVCPNCLSSSLQHAPNLVPPKHDPNNLPSSYPKYRSVVTHEVINNKQAFLDYVTHNGDYYFSNRFGKYCCFVNTPLSKIPGSGIPAYHPLPDHALSGLMVADPFGTPHIYAENPRRVSSEITIGGLSPIPECTVQGCSNKAQPNSDFCIEHGPRFLF